MKLHRKVCLYTQLYLVREILWSWMTLFMYRAGLIKTASKLNYAASLEKARMDAITSTVGNAGKLYFYGGTAGVLATATCRIVTAGGRTDDRTIYIRIKER